MSGYVDPALLDGSSAYNSWHNPTAHVPPVPTHDPTVTKDVEDEMGDLFGDAPAAPAGSVKAESSGTNGDIDDDGLTTVERQRRHAMEYGEDEDNVPVNIHRVVHTLSIPNQSKLRSSDGNIWLLRLPNYVKYEPRPFDPDSYVDVKPEEDKGQKVAADRSLSIQMETSNTLRWRWLQRPDGKYIRQSNSRIIKWDDGSMSLQLGKELYDISVNIDTSASISRSTIHGVGASQSLPSSQPMASQLTPSQVDTKPEGPIKGNGLAYVVSQHPEAAILRTEAQITGTMGLRPAGLQGSIHDKFRKALQQKHSKVSRLRFAQDEEVSAVERQIAELQKKPWKSARSAGGDGTRRRRSGGVRGGISAAERRRRAADMYSDEEEGEESDAGSDAGGYGGSSRPSARRPVGDPKRGPGEYEADDFLVLDEDEEESGRTPTKKRKRSKAEEDGLDEPDDLDMMDARIERLQKERKAATPDMDVDMEEDEEEEAANAIRKSSGKRRAAFVAGSDEE